MNRQSEKRIKRASPATLVLAALWMGLISAKSHAEIQPQVDFSGTWVLDRDTSDDLNDVLKAMGIGLFYRLIASKLTTTHIIRQENDRLHLTIENTFHTTHRTIPLDGSSTQFERADGGIQKGFSRWIQAGTVIAGEGHCPKVKDEPCVVKTFRQLKNPKMMVIRLVVQRNGKETIATRYFRKKIK